MGNKLPKGWKRERIGNLCDIVTGKKDVNAGSEDGQYPFFTCAQKVYKIKNYVFDDEAILVAGNGFFNVKYYKGKFDAYQRTYVLKGIKVNARYLYRYIQFALSDITKDNRGSTIKYIRLGDLANHFVPSPNPEEQKRIADKLDSLLAKVKDAQSRLDTIPVILNRFRQSVLAAAFSGELTKTWRKKNKVDAEWHEIPLGDVLTDLKYGTAKKCYREKKKYPVLRIPNVVQGCIDLTDLKYTDLNKKEYEGLELETGDILLIRSNGSVSLVGRTALVTKEEKGMAYAGYLIRLRANKELIIPEFLQYQFQSYAMRLQIELPARSTSGVNNINSNEVKNLQISLPSLDEQKEVVRRLKASFAFLEKNEKEFNNAKGYFDKLEQSILAKAFRGELVS